ncbi:tetratricopeptide repeat protein [Massilia sp. BJB1822]|nr:tetratricopeptide repeat protein [Massilia sp. BJB1822]
MAQHQRGALEQAAAGYAAVLQQSPDNFDALHLSGVLARQRGEPQRALELIGQALALDAAQAIAHCNRGAALQDLRRHDEALASYERALALRPGYAMALCNRGNALRHLGRIDSALDSYRAALEVQPDYPEALCGQGLALQLQERHGEALDSFGAVLGRRAADADALHGAAVSLHALGRYADAVDGYERALRQRPGWAEAWSNRGSALQRLHEHEAALESQQRALELDPASARAQLGCANALRALGRREEAVAAYRAAQTLGADADTVAFLLAALGAQPAPSASPPAYVRALFDQYAPDFEQHLVGALQYRTPQLLTALLDEHGAAPSGALDVLDLGCGSGLCARLLQPWARRLTGLDLSPQMLERAASLRLYDELVCAEMVGWLRQQHAAFDLIVAADVFVYAGALDSVLAAARQALRPGGWLAFSVEQSEAGEGGEHLLRASGRYAHSAAYLRRLAAEQGWRAPLLQAGTLRLDQGQPVAGWLALFSV